MTIISDLRGTGAEVLLDGGNLRVRNGRADLVERVKQHRDEVIAALRAEAFGDPIYEHSALRYRIERLQHLTAKHRAAGFATGRCDELLALLSEIERVACEDSVDSALRYVLANWPQIATLLQDIEDEKRGALAGALTGAALYEAARTAFTSRRINAAAFGS